MPSDNNAVAMSTALTTASDFCRARGNQIVEHSSDDETVVGSWEEPPNI